MGLRAIVTHLSVSFLACSALLSRKISPKTVTVLGALLCPLACAPHRESGACSSRQPLTMLAHWLSPLTAIRVHIFVLAHPVAHARPLPSLITCCCHLLANTAASSLPLGQGIQANCLTLTASLQFARPPQPLSAFTCHTRARHWRSQ
jgi:hypothetical protein